MTSIRRKRGSTDPLFARQSGLVRPLQFRRQMILKRIESISLDPIVRVEREHTGAVNSVTIEEAEARYLLSGGGDGNVFLYDLDESLRDDKFIIRSMACVPRSTDGHKGGISHVQWYPFDNGMFTTSSFDGTIRVWDTNSMQEACTFDLASKVYHHGLSSVATHGLIASAAADPRIRLCDMRTGAFTHSLPGHRGTVLGVNWSPRHEFTLASASTDSTVRLWDIRKSNSCLISLDFHNSGTQPLSEVNVAHSRAVNGVCFTPDGHHLITTGHDDKMRLWDTFTGRNTLVNYGTWIRNQFVHNVSPLVTPITACPYPIVFYPSDDRSILMFNLMDGSLMKRLTGAYGRITALTWRPRSEEIYTAGNDHTILAWGPRNKQRESLQQTLAEQDTWSDSDEEESW